MIALAVIFCWCFFSLQSCKEPLIKDTHLLTSDDDLNLAKDTLKLKVTSEFEQPLVSSGVATGLLGTLTDPNFGTTHTGFYAQYQLTTDAVYFGATPVLDSCVLTLEYSGLYGKFSTPVNVSAFELNQDISDSASYKTNSSFSVKTQPLGQVSNLVPDIIDSVVTLNGTLPPHLRVRLSNDFGKRILQDSADLATNETFLAAFKGLYVTATSNSGNGLAYLNLGSELSAVTLYYHNEIADSLYYTMPISGAVINHFDNIYTGTPVYNAIHSPNSLNAQKIYVQAGAGVNGKVVIANLDSIPKNIAINKAELTFTQSNSPNDTSYLPPLLLSLYQIDDAGQAITLDDEALGSIGGALYTQTINGVSYNRYQFNIKKYFQKLLQGIYHNNGLYLKASAPNTTSERIVLGNSSADKNYAVTLIITYTKL